VLDKVVSKYGIESIKFPDLSNPSTFFKKTHLRSLEKDVKKLKFGKSFKKLFASTKGAASTVRKFFKPNENKLWVGVSFITNCISWFVSLAAFAAPWLGGVSIVLDFLASIIYKKEYFSYIFETNDVKYIWNGGVEESWLLGLKKGECSTIDDMKLLEPMQVIKPNNLQGYYYNGEIYSDLSLLKTKQLMDVSNGRYINKNFKTVYSLIDLEKPDFINEELYDTSLDKLNKKFLNYVEKAINTGEFKNDSIVKPASYKFGSYVKNENLSIKGNIEKILESIKPTLIAQTPILNPEGSKYSRIPIFKNNTDANDNSISPYKLPGTSWTADGGLYNNNDYNFIIVDQNVIDKTEDDEESNDENQNDNNENIGLSRKNEVIDYNKKLENDFYNSFDVDSKVIDSQFVYSTKLFSDLSSKIESNFCYFATGRDLEENIFLNKNDAINWLLSEFDFATYYVEEKIEVYQIKDLAFTSKKKFMNWILSNIVEVK
ncbi:MAG: hypothetical protein K2K73_03240, partial [Ureaplasma sp.]|nr:hypothetical protein [Ureaplasma sp.]